MPKRIDVAFQDATCPQTSDNFNYGKTGLPEGWEWVRLGDVCEIYTGNSINETEKEQKYLGQKIGLPYIGTKDVSNEHKINYDNGIKIPDHSGFRIAPPNSSLLCIEGGSAGRKIAIADKEVCFGNKLCCFSSTITNPQFIYYYLQSDQFKQIFKSNINGIIGGVSVNKLKELLLPLPPLPEQHRIVSKINDLLSVCEKLQ